MGDSENESRWLNEQVLSLFTFHTMKALSVDAQCRVIGSLVPNEDATQTRNVVTFVESLRNSPDAGVGFFILALVMAPLSLEYNEFPSDRVHKINISSLCIYVHLHYHIYLHAVYVPTLS